jgi:hypothetical protein
MSDSEHLSGIPHPCRLRTASVGSRWASIDYVLTHTGFMGSRKLSSFDGHRVGRYLTSPVVMYTRIVYRPPTDIPKCGIAWKTCTRERWDSAWLFDHCCELRPLVVPLWLTCVVLSGYLSCKVYIDSNLCNTLRYEWWLAAHLNIVIELHLWFRWLMRLMLMMKIIIAYIKCCLTIPASLV